LKPGGKRYETTRVAKRTTLVHPRVLQFLNWLSSCALAQHSVTRKRISHPAQPPKLVQPARIAVRVPAPQMRVPANSAG